MKSNPTAKPFTCFKCGDGNTPLYCLNCANEAEQQLRKSVEADRDRLRKALLESYASLANRNPDFREQPIMWAALYPGDSESTVPNP